ncbi:hypothetical protein COCOBI_07-1200 [Coccomyxa sp. Obi]|nr:hypothetical protein COCOBI_07-1200 [Coccomyxa sp. Obi]
MGIHKYWVACFLLLFGFDLVQSDNYVYIISIKDLPREQQLAASVLVGLLNRAAERPFAIGEINPTDAAWIDSAQNEEPTLQNSTFLQVASLEELCVTARGRDAVLSRVLYSPDEPWSIANVATLAGIHLSVPVPTNSSTVASVISPQGFSLFEDLPVAFDTRGQWEDAPNATAWAIANLYPMCNETESLVVLQDPGLLQAGYLADLVAARQLFAFHMPDMCDANSTSAALFDTIAEAARFQGSLLSVMGYFPQQEVVALCSKHHTEISLVSDYCSSLSFWSRMPPVTGPLVQSPPLAARPYSRLRTYIAIIASDGDNMQMAFNVKRQRMEERLSECQVIGAACPPLAWTISNRLAEFAPFVLKWYFRQGATTGKDSFLMGPSGFGFMHPSIIAPDDPLIDVMINRTATAAAMLSSSAYVHWDNYDNEPAMVNYLSRLSSSNGPIQAVFSPITPYVPAKIGRLETFRESYRWFGTETIASVAQKLGGFPLGSLGYLYKLPDVTLDQVEALAKALPQHVELVGYRELTELAKARRATLAAPPGLPSQR